MLTCWSAPITAKKMHPTLRPTVRHQGASVAQTWEPDSLPIAIGEKRGIQITKFRAQTAELVKMKLWKARILDEGRKIYQQISLSNVMFKET